MENLLNLYYLNINQIGKLFNLSQRKAKRLYEIASKIDDEELKEYRIEPRKVRLKTCLKVQGISYKELIQRQEKEKPLQKDFR